MKQTPKSVLDKGGNKGKGVFDCDPVDDSNTTTEMVGIEWVTERTPDEDVIDYRDMTDMTNLNEAELTRNLEMRFKNEYNDYMTYVGSTLLVVNPFWGYKRFTNDTILKAYIQDTFCEEEQLYKDPYGPTPDVLTPKPPHNLAISALAFRQLFLDGVNMKPEKFKPPAICIAGESGAGKTESTK